MQSARRGSAGGHRDEAAIRPQHPYPFVRLNGACAGGEHRLRPGIELSGRVDVGHSDLAAVRHAFAAFGGEPHRRPVREQALHRDQTWSRFRIRDQRIERNARGQIELAAAGPPQRLQTRTRAGDLPPAAPTAGAALDSREPERQ